jgi:hypothetical protein
MRENEVGYFLHDFFNHCHDMCDIRAERDACIGQRNAMIIGIIIFG